MSNVRIELNRQGVAELMQSAEMMAVCSRLADRAASQLGSGYEVTTHVGKTRVNAEIAATTYDAKRDNLKNNTILKALGAVGE